MKSNGSYIDRVCDCLAAFMRRKQLTVGELNLELGFDDAGDQCGYNYMNRLADRGIVYVAGWVEYQPNKFKALYSLQSSPFELEDAPRPEVVTTRQIKQIKRTQRSQHGISQ